MNTDEHGSRFLADRIVYRSVLTVATGLFALNLWRYGSYLLDDTFISFRYAQNLVAGNGLVFNAGERVEGYTNFLFVLLAATCLRFGVDPIVATKGVSLACALLVTVVLVQLAPRRLALREDERTTWVALALLLPLPGFAYWAAASFETMLFTCVFLIALGLLQREHDGGEFRGAAIVFVLLALTRPEGLLLFLVATLVFAIVAAAHGRPALRRACVNVVTFGIGYGAYFAWRYTYYGDLFPNTFRAKVTGGWEQMITGLQYLGTWARAYPFLCVALVLPVACLSRRVRDAVAANGAMVAWYAVALIYAAYVTLVGGDFMPFHRFFVPLLPLCCLFLAWALSSLPAAWRTRVLVLVFPLHIACAYLTEEPYRAFVAHRTAVVGQRVGERLAHLLAPNDLIAVNTAGALPYYSERPAIDMLGLTDAAIAQRPVFIVSPGWAGHRRGWGQYVLSRRPRVIFFYNSSGSREPFYLSDHELADDPYFRFFYAAKTLTVAAVDDAASTRAPVGRFLGFPFGFDASGHAPWRDLGLESRFELSPVSYTVLYEGPTVAHYFELDARDAALWDLRQPGNIDAFLTTVIARWRAIPAPPADPDARETVDALCAAAHAKMQEHDTAAAKSLLTTAAQQNDRAHSALVYQYIANVAVLDSDLFTAVAAQKEALRLEPDNALYQRNLRALLAKPYKEGF